jgi:hypothetical protein
MDVRCQNKKHGEILDGVIEIKCSSRFCGAGSGVVVIHRWTLTGERLDDKRFRDPVSSAARQQKEGARL